jgi:polyphosphate kinase
VVALFHYFTGHSEAPVCPSLLVAPHTMRRRFLDLIQREINNRRAGLPARIIAKMNQLEDPELIEAICTAAAAGVPVDLIIRGFCCVKPGVPGHTEGIRVRSIIGRFLEHSRIFHFAAGLSDPVQGEFFIGSADWMFRNVSKRVEVVAPVLAHGLRRRLWEILDICLRDRRQAWVLDHEGAYSQLHADGATSGPEALGTHETLMELTRRRCN